MPGEDGFMKSAHIALVALALALPGAAFGAEDAFVTVPSGTTQTLTLQQGGAYSTRVGVVARDAGPALGGLDFKAFEVQYKESRSPELLSRFEVVKEPATSTHGDALAINVPPAADELLPGNYVLTVQVLPKARGGKPQSLVFTLAKPAAVLSAGSAVLVERIGSWSDEPARTFAGRVRLTEESRVANLTGLTFATDLERKAGTPAPDGQVVVCAQTSHLAANQSIECDASLTGEFPFGTHTGKITVRSPQLAAPVAMNITVLSRRDPRWLIGLALAGAVLGYLVRVHFKRRKELAEAEITASLARQKVGIAWDRIEDPTARARIRAEIDALDSTVERRKAAEIVTAAATALTNLQAIEKDFNDRRTAFEPHVKKVDALLAKTFILPAPIQEAFAPVAARCEDLLAAFRRNNLVEADERLKRLNRENLVALVELSIAWRASFVDLLSTLDRPSTPLGDAARAKLHAAAEAARNLLPEAPPTVADISSADAELEAAHRTFNGGRKVVDDVADGLDNFLSRAQELLDTVVTTHPADWQAIEDLTTKVRELLDAPLDRQLDRRAETVDGRLQFLAIAWVDWLTRHVPVPQHEPIQQHLGAGRWDTAIVEAAKAIKAAPADDEIAFLENRSIRDAAAVALRLRAEDDFGSADLDQRPGVGPSGIGSFALTGTEGERGRLRLTTILLEFAQTAIVGVLFVFGVYALNADTWIGTLKDMFTIFALAFAADLTADGALAALKK